MVDIIILMVGMLAFVGFGALINHVAQTLYWWYYDWRLSREDDRLVEEQYTEEEADNVLKFKRSVSDSTE